MIIVIRETTVNDLPFVMDIYNTARQFMSSIGNVDQWTKGYPSEQFIKEEIEARHSFVCENQDGVLVGTFCFIIGDDPTYAEIYDGQWLNNEIYGTIHRIASSGIEKNVANSCIEWCFTKCKNIRIDTHRNNIVMKNIIKNQGFSYCGVIYLLDGSERIAFQKKI